MAKYFNSIPIEIEASVQSSLERVPKDPGPTQHLLKLQLASIKGGSTIPVTVPEIRQVMTNSKHFSTGPEYSNSHSGWKLIMLTTNGSTLVLVAQGYPLQIIR